ncbi:MAG: aminotransferase class III-fold pyridoxal phosphate-dependent enzyme [Lentisphaeria bacterium]|nr:aminotransferase class III-fold pyridoxal phosphate-dependent enzyme [Lentisphaeria bacterium]
MSAPQCEAWVKRIESVLPYGSSTNSKAVNFLPEEPAIVERAKGCRVWDVDGREFIDFRNGLGPITLGHCFPAVDEALREQLGRGIVYSHPHRLEAEVAERICEVIPCAERARFLKTGGEANAACFRLARAFTGREHIVQIGYNGWINSVAAGGVFRPGETAVNAPPGVPAGLARLHHGCGWNDIAALEALFEALPDQIAAVAVSASYAGMAAGETFYPALRELTRKHGTLLIYDEIVTGFRIAIAGVQEYFGVTPDLAVFAKGVANGMPLSVYCGRADVMGLCDRGGSVCISSTYGGEALSLAAAKTVIDVYCEENVVGHLWSMGERMWGSLNGMFREHGVPLEFKGPWPCPQLTAGSDAPTDLVSRFMRAAFRNRVVLYNVSYVNFSVHEADAVEALERLEKAISEL